MWEDVQGLIGERCYFIMKPSWEVYTRDRVVFVRQPHWFPRGRGAEGQLGGDGTVEKGHILSGNICEYVRKNLHRRIWRKR